MKDAGVAPPGTIPMKQPTAAERIEVCQYFGSRFQVWTTTRKLIFADAPLKASPSSNVSRISPMPNNPITAMRKSNPASMCVEPKVSRSVPVTGSEPTAASAKPNIIDARVLNTGSLLVLTKAQNVSRYTAKNSGGPNSSANRATIGDRKVITITATSAPTNDEVNAAVSASPARPFCASG